MAWHERKTGRRAERQERPAPSQQSMVQDYERGQQRRDRSRIPGRPTPASATGTTSARSTRTTSTRRRSSRQDAGGHRQQERQPAAEHPAARRRHDRPGRTGVPARHGRLDGRQRRVRSSPPAPGRFPAKGPCRVEGGGFSEGGRSDYTAEDFRFYQGQYAVRDGLGWPDGRQSTRSRRSPTSAGHRRRCHRGASARRAGAS